MQRNTLLKILFVVVVLSLVAVSIIYFSTHNSPQSQAATPSPTPVTTPTLTPQPTDTPVETVAFQAVSVDSAHVISVQVCSKSRQNITLTQAIIKGENGNILATNNSLNNTLPANGSNIKITLQIDQVTFFSGGPYTLTLTSEQGNDFTAPRIFTTSQSYRDSSIN